MPVPKGYRIETPQNAPANVPHGYRLENAPQAQQGPPAPPQQGFFSSAAEASGLPALAHMGYQVLRHPIDSLGTVAEAGKLALPVRNADGSWAAAPKSTQNQNPVLRTVNGMVDNTVNNFKQGVADYKKTGLSVQTRRDFGRAVPIVGPAFDKAATQMEAGNTAGGVGTMLGLAGGLVAPELLKGAPVVAGKVLGLTGEALQDSGAARYGKFLNGGKRLPVGEAPGAGRAVLESGPSTSIATNRPQLTQNINAARQAAGPDIAAAVQSSPARIPLPTLKGAVTDVLDPMRQTVNGPLGNPRMLGRLDEIQDSFGPTLNYNGTTTPATVWDGLKTMDKNLNFNKGADAIEVTANNAGKRIRANTSAVLKDAVPEAVQPIQRYADLSDALDLAKDSQDIPMVKWNSLGRNAADVVIGGGAGLALHSPEAAMFAGAATHFAPMIWKLPAIQTGLATGAFQAGRALKSLAPGVTAAAPYVDTALKSLPAFVPRMLPTASANLGLTPAGEPQQNQERGYNDQGDQSQQSYQGAPPGGASSLPLTRLAMPAPQTMQLKTVVQADPSRGIQPVQLPTISAPAQTSPQRLQMIPPPSGQRLLLPIPQRFRLAGNQ